MYGGTGDTAKPLTHKPDDAIVVVSRGALQERCDPVETMIVPASVRARIGVEASEGLVEMFTQYQQFSTDRYERRLMHEVGALRLELHDGLARLRVELERTRSD